MKFIPALIALATAAVTGSAMAGSVALTNLDGTFSFSGFDYSSVGQGLVTGYDITSASPTGTVDPFTLMFQANATGLIDGNGHDINPSLIPGLNSTYEYTVFATVNETATCFAAGPDGPCSIVGLNIVGGTFSIYYDINEATFANYNTGTGFTDGTLLVSGTFSGGNTVLTAQGPTNPGNNSLGATFYGEVLSTLAPFIVPSLSGTTATSTLQFGNTQTGNFITPVAFNGTPVGPTSNTNFTFQADANQSFRAVPEPGSLALVGIALAGLGIVSRRRDRKA